MKKLYQRMLALILAMGILVSGMPPKTVYAQDGEEEPVLTIACLSDLHNQMALIEGNVENVRLRGTVTRTLEAIKEQEEIDLMILCGDYTSDSENIPKENWLKIRELMVQATKDVFPDPENTPVLWVDGNHDYEITREYNAGDYYNYPMKDDVGELPEEDSFYEWAPGHENDEDDEFKLLAAYYYQLYGFDFLCLNTGNIIFEYPNGMGRYTDYRYSVESVEWVRQKLEEIYKDDPEKKKTVFFVTHIPFNDSNSINVGKGLDEDHKATQMLKQTLAEYPNLLHLYGHDHGGNAAFIRTATEQRVTQYDMDGNKISNEKHSPLWQIEKVSSGYTIRSLADGKYLGYANSNLTLSDTEQLCQIEQVSDGYYVTTNNTARPYVYFSASSNTFSANNAACEIELLRQTNAEDGRYSFTAADGEIEDGIYAMAKTSGEKIYLMTDETNGASDINLRMLPVIAELDQNNIIYKETEKKDVSFLTSFVGSMRYYSNDINYPSSPNDSDVVQALMVYVYNDRIELHMKNYGAYDYYDMDHIFSTQPIFIAKNPIPYFINRKVLNNFADTADLKALVDEVEKMILTGYSAESVKNLTTQLAAAKRVLRLEEEYRKMPVLQNGIQVATQSTIDYLFSRLTAAKKGLKPEEPKKTDTEQPIQQPIQQPVVQIPKLPKFALKATAKKTGKVALSWKKQSTAKGYVIQMKKNKGGFKQLAKITKKATVKKTTKKLAKGTYKFRIRSYAVYKDASGKNQTVYSPYSKTVTVKIKK